MKLVAHEAHVFSLLLLLLLCLGYSIGASAIDIIMLYYYYQCCCCCSAAIDTATTNVVLLFVLSMPCPASVNILIILNSQKKKNI